MRWNWGVVCGFAFMRKKGKVWHVEVVPKGRGRRWHYPREHGMQDFANRGGKR